MNFFSKRKSAVLFTLIVMVLGAATFLLIRGTATEDMNKKSAMLPSDSELFDTMEFKVVTTPEGGLKLFALANPNSLSAFPAEGESIPRQNTVVIGSAEAKMMLDEGLINGTGTILTDFFGIDVTVGGILDETNSITDDLHFLSENNFERLDGESERVVVRFTEDRTPKFFFMADVGANLSWNLSEGDWTGYKEHELLGKNYLPIVIGSKEAEMMKSENLFKSAGDRIDGFFGKNVIVVGVMAPTNSSLDMMHTIPSSFIDSGVDG
jgi:hypothetical protein